MQAWFQTVTDLHEGADVLRRRSYGIIECRDGRLWCVRLRPFPKVVTAPGVWMLGNWQHRRWPGDRCLLYYNQPWRFRNYLALQYIVSSRDATRGTVTRALETFDEIARLKQSDALLCDAANWRISDRMLARYGWELLCPSMLHRYFIKRFYGRYPSSSGVCAREDVTVGECVGVGPVS